ncbi:MAG: response regulator [Candidatus Hydrogenedens sp.]|nr:response regulator [Candidatus Hydrogenedens sp.]
MTTILLTEDDQVQREIITDILTSSGFGVRAAASGEEALALLDEAPSDLLLSDLKMPGMDGLALLRAARARRPETEVILMTAHGTIRTAVQAMREGAIDYLEKPFDKDALLHVITRASERTTLRRENKQLRDLVSVSVSLGNIVGESPAMREVFQRTQRAAQVQSTVLILGESGTGKELIARHIHFEGPRAKKPFVVVNCAAIPDSLVESELFGHEKGAFTGADMTRVGKFEAAHGGTIFLDEIGDMPLEAQAKLLRVLQGGKVERVGANDGRQVDVRAIVATNRNLKQRVAEGEFREDLYYRLEVLPIELPPLRERLTDLPLLVHHFREKLGKKLGLTPPAISPDLLDAFRGYDWPGNVRELEHVLEQCFVLASGDTLRVEDLPAKLRHPAPKSGGFELPPSGVILEDLEQDLIRQALERTDGKLKDAAQLLGLTYKTLQYRLKKHDIER